MLRTTAIMKTDIRDSTMRFRMLSEVDLEALLTGHRQFVSRLVKAHHGRVVKKDLGGTPWEARLRPVDIGPGSPRLADVEIYRLWTSEPNSH